MSTFDLNRFNLASLLAITALIFLFLVVLGLGRPVFAADFSNTGRLSARDAGGLNSTLTCLDRRS